MKRISECGLAYMMQMSSRAEKVLQTHLPADRIANNTTLEVHGAFNRISAHDHPGGEPPHLPDLGARPILRGCKRDVEYGRPSGHEADLQEAMLRLGPHRQKMTDLADLVMFSIHEEQARARQGCQEI